MDENRTQSLRGTDAQLQQEWQTVNASRVAEYGGQRRYVRPGEMRSVSVIFAANGYLVSENEQQHRVFPTASAMIAYITEITMGGPGSAVLTPVEPELAGLDLGPVPARDGDIYEMDESALMNLDEPQSHTLSCASMQPRRADTKPVPCDCRDE